MKDNVIYKIEPIELITYFLRLFAVTALVLMIINFKINPLAFSIFSGIAIIILGLSATSHLFIYPDKFVIELKRPFRFFNRKYIYKFDEIESIEYSKGFFNPLNLIEYIPGTNKPREYVINYIDERESENVGIIGSRSKAIEAMEIMNKLIEKRKTKSHNR